jgi:hypothetical protein
VCCSRCCLSRLNLLLQLLQHRVLILAGENSLLSSLRCCDNGELFSTCHQTARHVHLPKHNLGPLTDTVLYDDVDNVIAHRLHCSAHAFGVSASSHGAVHLQMTKENVLGKALHCMY